MPDIVLWTPEQHRAQSVRRQSTLPSLPTYPTRDLYAEGERSTFQDAFTASFQRENLMIELGNRLATGSNVQTGDDFGPDFNPITYMRETWEEDRFNNHELQIRQGLFNDARSPGDIEIRAQLLEREKELLKTIEGGPALGVFLGGMAGALADLTTFVPFGALSKAARSVHFVGQSLKRFDQASPIARGAAIGGAVTALPELGLQASQELRSAQESFLNIGVGTLIGGGIGTFSRFANPDHPMSPGHPDNPTDVTKDYPVGTRDQLTGEVEIIYPESEVGAARNLDATPEKLPGLLSKIPGFNKMVDKFTKGRFKGLTPATRAFKRESPLARQVSLMLSDHGGIYTNLNRMGLSNAPEGSADDIKAVVMTRLVNLQVQGEGILYRLNEKLGMKKTPSFFRQQRKGRINEPEFADIMRKRHRGTWTDADEQSLASQFGAEAAPEILKAADEWSSRLGDMNDQIADDLVDIGAVQNEQLLNTWRAERDALRQKIEEARQKPAEGEQPAVSPEELAELRRQRDAISDDIRDEEAKPELLGRDYLAQMWDDASLSEDPDGAYDFFLGVLANDPNPEWLSTAHQIDPQDWSKLGNEPVTTIDGEELSIEAGLQRKQDILKDWAGDELFFRMNKAEMAETAAQERLDVARQDLTSLYKALGLVDRRVGSLKVSEARKFRDRFNANMEEARSRKDQLAREHAAFKDAAEAARRGGLERQRGFVDIQGQIEAIGERSAERVTRAETRAKVAAKELYKADARLKRMEARAQRLDEAHREVETRLQRHEDAQRFLKEAVADARRENRIAETDLKKAKKEIAKLRKATPLDDEIEDLLYKLSNRNVLPHGIIDRFGDPTRSFERETGRLKARRLHLNKEQTIEAERKGYLRRDLMGILSGQVYQVAGTIGLRKALSIGPNGKYKSWQEVMRAVDDDYRRLISDARRNGQDDRVPLIQSDREGAIKDMQILKDRILGTEDVGADRGGFWYWGSQKVLEGNFLRFGAGLLPASLTDAGTVRLRAGPLAKLIRSHGSELVDTMKSAMDENPSEFAALMMGMEQSAQGMRIAQIGDLEDSMRMFGIGPRGSMQHTVTGNIDRAGRWMTERTNIVSGMKYWNRFWKGLAAIQRKYKLKEMTAKYDDLTEFEKADLASLGISRSDAKAIARMTEKYGVDMGEGRFDPRLEEWAKSGPQARKAAMKYRAAILRDIDRAVPTPGIADRPRLQSHAVGKVLLQYQSYALTFNSKFLIPASQRLANWQDAQALSAYGHLAFAGAAVVIAKDLLRGEDPEKIKERFSAKEWPETTVDIMDRMGLYAGMTPFVNSALKLSAGAQEAAFGEAIIGSPSRFARNRWFDDLLGANFGGFRRDIQEFAGDLSAGEMDQIRKKGLLLLPWNFWLRTGNVLDTAIRE